VEWEGVHLGNLSLDDASVLDVDGEDGERSKNERDNMKIMNNPIPFSLLNVSLIDSSVSANLSDLRKVPSFFQSFSIFIFHFQFKLSFLLFCNISFKKLKFLYKGRKKIMGEIQNLIFIF
jgi:hypothetical protein